MDNTDIKVYPHPIEQIEELALIICRHRPSCEELGEAGAAAIAARIADLAEGLFLDLGL